MTTSKDSWEPIQETEGSGTYRMKVPGGWLYKVVETAFDGDILTHLAIALTFVPQSTARKTDR